MEGTASTVSLSRCLLVRLWPPLKFSQISDNHGADNFSGEQPAGSLSPCPPRATRFLIVMALIISQFEIAVQDCPPCLLVSLMGHHGSCPQFLIIMALIISRAAPPCRLCSSVPNRFLLCVFLCVLCALCGELSSCVVERHVAIMARASVSDNHGADNFSGRPALPTLFFRSQSLSSLCFLCFLCAFVLDDGQVPDPRHYYFIIRCESPGANASSTPPNRKRESPAAHGQQDRSQRTTTSPLHRARGSDTARRRIRCPRTAF